MNDIALEYSYFPPMTGAEMEKKFGEKTAKLILETWVNNEWCKETDNIICKCGYCIYRSRISPGPQHEIVPEDGVVEEGDEYTFDGVNWHLCKSSMLGKSCDYHFRFAPHPSVLAIRRKLSREIETEQKDSEGTTKGTLEAFKNVIEGLPSPLAETKEKKGGDERCDAPVVPTLADCQMTSAQSTEKVISPAPEETNGASLSQQLVTYVHEHFWWRLSGSPTHVIKQEEVAELQRLSELASKEPQQQPTPTWTPFSERMPTDKDCPIECFYETRDDRGINRFDGIHYFEESYTHWRKANNDYPPIPQPIKTDAEIGLEESKMVWAKQEEPLTLGIEHRLADFFFKAGASWHEKKGKQ